MSSPSRGKQEEARREPRFGGVEQGGRELDQASEPPQLFGVEPPRPLRPEARTGIRRCGLHRRQAERGEVAAARAPHRSRFAEIRVQI